MIKTNTAFGTHAMNLISLVYIVKDVSDFNAKMKNVAKNIDSIIYPKDHFEAIFIINSLGHGKKVTDSLPLIKLYYVRHINAEHYICAIKNALGDIIVFVDGAHLFNPEDLNYINSTVKQNSWITKEWIACNKSDIPLLPKDLFCLASFVDLNISNGSNTRTFHRKEILRHLYKAQYPSQIMWMAWKYLRGRK